MQTRCPQCRTVFALADDPAPAAGAHVPCPSCGHAVDAHAFLTEATAADHAATLGAGTERAQGDLFATRARPSMPSSVPRFARERVRSRRPGQWYWWLASAVLLAALAMIVPIADRDALARDAQWRPQIAAICAALGCTIPPWHDPKAFAVTAREFNPHPSVKGVRLVTVSFRNDAPFAQGWPLLQLTASDLNGRVVGLRRFGPLEYLGGAPESPLLQPGQAANATLEVVDPDAVSWSIDFR